MTTPYERYRSLKWSIELLREMRIDPAIPDNYKQQILMTLRHLPTPAEWDQIVDSLEGRIDQPRDPFVPHWLSTKEDT